MDAPIPRSGCRNAIRSCGLDMKRGATWFPRLLVIANPAPIEGRSTRSRMNLAGSFKIVIT